MHKIEYSKMYKGMPVVVLFAEGYNPHRCGYVGVNNNHKLYGLDYRDKIYMGKDWIANREIGDRGVLSLFCFALNDDKENIPLDVLFEVHGGLTFSSGRDGWKDYPILSDFWFFGFDCAHSDDTLSKWSFRRVWNETRKLADQIEEFRNKEIIIKKGE